MTKKGTTQVSCSKEAELATMSANLSNMNKKINEIHKHIIGQERPGLLERVSNLEIGSKVAYAITGIALAVITFFKRV